MNFFSFLKLCFESFGGGKRNEKDDDEDKKEEKTSFQIS